MAQPSKVTGKVLSDEDGEAIIGATVMVKGTTIGTVTDADGFFNLSNVPNSAKVLEISFVGMETMTVKIAPNLTIRMKNSSEMLDEVLVTGTYGSAKKLGSMVGSVAAVKSEKISNRPSANFADALQGQVAVSYTHLFMRPWDLTDLFLKVPVKLRIMINGICMLVRVKYPDSEVRVNIFRPAILLRS